MKSIYTDKSIEKLSPRLNRGGGGREADNDFDSSPVLLHQETEPTTKISDIFGSSASSASSFGEVPSPASSSAVDLEEEGLARRALKGRERWVFCEHEEKEGRMRKKNGGLLKLKLDYEEVWSAWSDKGPVFIDGEAPQVVPELMKGWYEDDSVVPSNVLVEVGNASARAVPEMEVDGKEKISEGDNNKMKREERVMRYKAKRQSRLFAKRIRYEVRKLNAEKRPRIKGRFVKRVDDM
ncbi:uncharacterized protein A4U43_C04F5940 [Asparagus officinalis]|uniref:CCT domain-containing protein n=1 Tax=Asparagus officinalis TaxID=4686 RepID=A0A5P1F0F2_ASPOF|nr:uncharacterized protein A4U43_C04F5940 [Asparagus officinalis]